MNCKIKKIIELQKKAEEAKSDYVTEIQNSFDVGMTYEQVRAKLIDLNVITDKTDDRFTTWVYTKLFSWNEPLTGGTLHDLEEAIEKYIDQQIELNYE